MDFYCLFCFLNAVHMAKVELGFTGERFIYLPLPMIRLMDDSSLTSDLYIYSMGYFSRASHHYINRPSGCDEFLFIYCKEGLGWIELYGKKITMEANQFIILPRNVAHAYGANNINPWTIYWIHFRGTKAPVFSSNFDSPTDILPSDVSRIEDRIDLFEEIFFILNESSSLDNMHYANLCFAHFLGSFLFLDVYRKGRRHKEYAENVINRVIHYMNDNIESNLKLQDFAMFCGYSESYFYRRFIKETGHSPMNYFIRLKINKACWFLIQTDMKVNQIAYKLGFRESQYFSRTFTHIMGISALEFRKQNFKL